jgi:hypothetical protein
LRNNFKTSGNVMKNAAQEKKNARAKIEKAGGKILGTMQ